MSGWKSDDVALVRLEYLETGVLVIDPESREAAERLADALLGDAAGVAAVESVQTALRSLVTPPKPDEPQGLGAVAEDAEGARWVRIPIPDFDKPWTDAAGVGRHVHWTAVDAVRVLSEGVQP